MQKLDMSPKLPKHLFEEILAWLPVESLCRFRSVCKEWNAMILSTKFVTNTWVEKPPNRRPWLVLVPVSRSGLVFSFSNRTWKETSPISLSFLLEKEVKNECSLYVYVYGSAAGLFLVQISPSYEYVVANPLTRTFLELPLLSSIPKISNMGIVGGESNIQDTYKVVAVGMSSDLNAGYIVEIYNSIDKSWRIAGHLPKDVKPVEMPVVFCAGAFYCNGFIHGERVIVVFDIKEGTSIFVPLPNIVDNYRMVPYLLACGSRVLVAGHDAEPLQFIIWEFDKVKVNSSSTSTSSSSSSWGKEIARMPQSDLERFSLLNGTISWAGVGDCACFILAEHKMTEVVVYNVTENTWSWLPSLPLDTERSWQGYQLSVAFEPRPDMKVG